MAHSQSPWQGELSTWGLWTSIEWQDHPISNFGWVKWWVPGEQHVVEGFIELSDVEIACVDVMGIVLWESANLCDIYFVLLVLAAGPNQQQHQQVQPATVRLWEQHCFRWIIVIVVYNISIFVSTQPHLSYSVFHNSNTNINHDLCFFLGCPRLPSGFIDLSFFSSSSWLITLLFLSSSTFFSFSTLRMYLLKLSINRIFFRRLSYRSAFCLVAIILSGMFSPLNTSFSRSSILPGSPAGLMRSCCLEYTFWFRNN